MTMVKWSGALILQFSKDSKEILKNDNIICINIETFIVSKKYHWSQIYVAKTLASEYIMAFTVSDGSVIHVSSESSLV